MGRSTRRGARPPFVRLTRRGCQRRPGRCCRRPGVEPAEPPPPPPLPSRRAPPPHAGLPAHNGAGRPGGRCGSGGPLPPRGSPPAAGSQRARRAAGPTPQGSSPRAAPAPAALFPRPPPAPPAPAGRLPSERTEPLTCERAG